ncbi:MAG: hypothetical protein E6H92_12600 [Chloroflexi bacterium]|nr:MAG: hypothetical protein E6H92_12600 [Chloroflexota bacterium]
MREVKAASTAGRTWSRLAASFRAGITTLSAQPGRIAGATPCAAKEGIPSITGYRVRQAMQTSSSPSALRAPRHFAQTRPPGLCMVSTGGTQDILVFEAGTVIENAVQMVMPSPTMLVAARVRQATADRKDLLLTGVTMGGGPGHWAVESHLSAGLRVFATPQAARTFDDDLDRVQAMGIRVVDDGEVARYSSCTHLELRDFYFDAVAQALTAFGVPTEFDALAVAVFDHGAAPAGYSDRRFRFDYLREQVARGARLENFGFWTPLRQPSWGRWRIRPCGRCVGRCWSTSATFTRSPCASRTDRFAQCSNTTRAS